MHLADAFIQSDLQCIQAIHFFVSMFTNIFWSTSCFQETKNADELKAAIKETWASIPPQQCHKLITIEFIALCIEFI